MHACAVAVRKLDMSARRAKRVITVSSDGVAIESLAVAGRRESRQGWRWAEVVRITAYKQDLLTIDRVCLRVQLEDGSALEVTEDDAGWQELLDALPVHLEGGLSVREWWRSVVVPPFATCERTIHERAS